MVERSVAAGAMAEQLRELGLAYPRQIYSMSHLSLPFPVTDALYGMEPSGDDDFGINFRPPDLRDYVLTSVFVKARLGAMDFR
jgi:hypothetical protein